MFFRPIEPFLIDAAADRKAPGRIPRAGLEPVWTWISRDLAPVECKAYCDEVNGAIAAGDMEPSASLALSLHEVSAQRMHAALASAETDEKARRRMSTQFAMPNAPDHIRDIATILSCRDALELIESRLPGHIRNLSEGTLDNAKSLLDSPICAELNP